MRKSKVESSPHHEDYLAKLVRGWPYRSLEAYAKETHNEEISEIAFRRYAKQNNISRAVAVSQASQVGRILKGEDLSMKLYEGIKELKGIKKLIARQTQIVDDLLEKDGEERSFECHKARALLFKMLKESLLLKRDLGLLPVVKQQVTVSEVEQQDKQVDKAKVLEKFNRFMASVNQGQDSSNEN